MICISAIQYVDAVKYLGYDFNREFSNEILKISYYALSQLYPSKYTLPTHIKLNFMKSLIIPTFAEAMTQKLQKLIE